MNWIILPFYRLVKIKISEILILPCTFPPVLPAKIRRSHFAMQISSTITCPIAKISICHVHFLQHYLSNSENLYLPCTLPPVLPVKNSKVSICHVHFLLNYLSKFECLILPCTSPPVLPAKIRMPHFAMQISSTITCQIAKISICHVHFLQHYLSKFKSLNSPCTFPPALPVKIRMSHFAMYISNKITWVVSTLYAKIRLNPSKIKGFRGYKPLPPLSLAYQPSILLRETSQGRAESPFISALTGIP